MRGSIRSRQTCPMCGRKGQYRAVRGRGSTALVCRCNQSVSDKPEYVVRWKNKVYWIRHDQAGNRLATYEQAERVQAAVTDQIDKGKFLPQIWAGQARNKLLWENHLVDYLARESRRLLPNQKATHDKKRALLRHTAWFNGLTIREIRTGHLEDFAALPCLRLALSPKTIQDLMGEIRFMFNAAYSRDELERVPAVPKITVPKRKIQWLTADQQLHVLEQIPAQHRPIFIFMMDYGVRPGEACALCWDMVAMDKGEFHISRTFSRRMLRDLNKQKEDNTLPIANWFAEYLEATPTGIHRTPVFKNPEANASKNPDGFYLYDFLSSLWKQAVKGAELPEITLKDATRHSVANQKIRAGWDPNLVAALLGHGSLRTTDRSYISRAAKVEALRRRLNSDG